MGSLRRGAPVQGPAGIGARPFDLTDARWDLKLAWFAGVDWGSRKHQACVLDADGEVLGEREFEHGGAGLSQMADWLLSFATGDAGDVGVAIETPSGPVVESLLEHGVAVHSINPTQRDRFRDRFSPAGAKDDRRDARVLASALRTDAHCLRRLERTDPAIVELREWSRLSEELTRERVRLANQMRQQLWRYYPQFLAAVDDDVAAPWALDLWRSLPTPRAGQRVRGLTLTRVLKQHRIRRIDAATLRDRLRAPAVTLTPGTVEAALLRGSKTDPRRPLPTGPLTTDSVRRRPTKLSHLIEDVTCEDGLRLLPRSTARSKALPDDQLVPEEGVLHTGLLMVARVLLPLSPSSLLHLSDRAVARGRSWSPSRHGGCPGRWNDDRRATRTRGLVDATRVVGRVRREAGDVAFDLVDQIEGRRRVVNMPAGQGVSDDHARSVDAQMKLLPAAHTASAMFHGRPFTFTHSREPGTVDDEMYACARGEAAKCKVEVLTTP